MLIRRQDKKAIFNIDTCRVLYVAETVGLKSAQTNSNSLELTKQKKEQWKFWT